ncbi:MAG: hypothetical protein AB8F94_15165 [Saprospiraceae bacterium]
MKNLCRIICMVGLILVHFNLSAQIEKTKTIDESFAVQKGAFVQISHQKGAMYVKKSMTNKVEVRLYVLVEGNKEKDVERMLNTINIEHNGNDKSQLEITTKTNTTNWSKINGVSTVKLNTGVQLKGIQEMQVDMEVSVPEGVNLKLMNKYDNITLEEIEANVEISNYNGNIETQNIDGDLKVDLKYGNATIGSVKNADLEIYESKLVMGNCNSLKLNSKYSKHTFSKIQEADIESYEGNFEISKIERKLNINDKYSVWTIGSIKLAKIKSYDGEWTVGSIEDLFVRGKESEYTIGSAENVDCEKSYQDEFKIGTLGIFKCGDSKYIEVEVGTLKKGIYATQTYNGEIEVTKVLSSFEGAEFSGKKSDLELPLDNMRYQLELDVKNADISLEEDNLDAGFVSEKNNHLQIKGKMNKANDRSPKVIIKGINLDIEFD